jgi:hypothetical protein
MPCGAPRGTCRIVTINGWNRLAVSTHMVYEP